MPSRCAIYYSNAYHTSAQQAISYSLTDRLLVVGIASPRIVLWAVLSKLEMSHDTGDLKYAFAVQYLHCFGQVAINQSRWDLIPH